MARRQTTDSFKSYDVLPHGTISFDDLDIKAFRQLDGYLQNMAKDVCNFVAGYITEKVYSKKPVNPKYYHRSFQMVNSVKYPKSIKINYDRKSQNFQIDIEFRHGAYHKAYYGARSGEEVNTLALLNAGWHWPGIRESGNLKNGGGLEYFEWRKFPGKGWALGASLALNNHLSQRYGVSHAKTEFTFN